MNSIGVKYLKSTNGTVYTFHCPEHILSTLKAGDMVVVEDVNEFSVVEVVDLVVKPWGKGERSVIQKVDVEAAKAYATKKRQKDVILKALEARTIEAKRMTEFAELAKTDPETAKLLTDFELL